MGSRYMTRDHTRYSCHSNITHNISISLGNCEYCEEYPIELEYYTKSFHSAEKLRKVFNSLTIQISNVACLNFKYLDLGYILEIYF